MKRYTIFCTEEQTRKALELGAPIEANKDYSNGNITETLCVYGDIINKDAYGIGECTILHIPTAEQMIGWLEEQEPIKEIAIYRYERLSRRYWCYDIFDEKGYCLSVEEEYRGEGYSSRKEATLATIDAALEYLISNKKNESSC